MITIAIQLIIFFQIKHFLADFVWQSPYQYLNKGKYGHPGGILHAFIHGAATFFILPGIGLALILAVAEAVIHYHIDWAKVKINTRYNLKADNSKYFWWLLGADQLLHQLTYAMLICAVLVSI